MPDTNRPVFEIITADQHPYGKVPYTPSERRRNVEAPGTDDIAVKAWAAGFFDGEGCVLIYSYVGNELSTAVSISNTHRASLEIIESVYGGRISEIKMRDLAKQQSYIWQLGGKNSEAFVSDILPYSVVKKPQLELYLYARTLLRTDNHDERLRVITECKRLKKVAS